MSDKNVLIEDKIIKGISDECPETDGSENILVSTKGLYDLRQELLAQIIAADGNIIEVVNNELIVALTKQLGIINSNSQLIAEIDTIIDTGFDDIENSVSVIEGEVTTVNENMIELEEKSAQSTTNLNNLNSALARMEVRDFVSITIDGDDDKFYPVYWKFDNHEPCTIVIKRDGAGESNRGVYIELVGIGGNVKEEYARSLFIKEFTDKGGISAKLLSLNMYSFEGTGNQGNSDFIAHCASGLYLRGAATYQLYCELQSIRVAIQSQVMDGVASVKSVSENSRTYMMIPISESDMVALPSDPALRFENSINKYIMPGDIAVHHGGQYTFNSDLTQTNSIHQSSVSTGAAAVITGTLPIALWGMVATSNSSGDIALSASGESDITSFAFKYKSIISTGGDAIPLISLANPQKNMASTSNGYKDMACFIGGGSDGNYSSSIEKNIISTDVVVTTTPQMAVATGNSGATSNLIYDTGILVGGQVDNGNSMAVLTDAIHQFVVSNDVDSIVTGALNISCDGGRLVSNGIADTCLDVEGSPVVEYARTIIISTAANSVLSGSINTYGYKSASQASNSVGDRAVYAGGDAYTDTIRQYVISTPSCALAPGALTESLRAAAGTSNG